MRALRRFTVQAALPDTLAPLTDLVLNLRWSWHPPTIDLFASVDEDLWVTSGRDPIKMLGAVSSERLEELAADGRFVERLNAAAADLQSYLTEPKWFQGLDPATVPPAIGYFSPEYGITEVLPQYSGGLGILAGDHLKAASDLGVPVLGVGLFYRAGYFQQSLSPDGWQEEHYPPIDPFGLPLTQLTDDAGSPLVISVGLPEGGSLSAHIWKAQVGRVPLLLLDSQIEENDEHAREVTDKLYGGGTDHRLLQEMLLGVGGVRAIRAYCQQSGAPVPEVFHTNEGHAGFLGLERMRELTEDSGLTFAEALQAVRAGTVFTTHTPVPAGIDRFPKDLIRAHFGGNSEASGLPVEQILELGAEADPNVFNMAVMGMRLAQRANGVSKLHGEVSRGMFGDLWSGFEPDEVPISSITNGVHAPTWVAREMIDLAESGAGAGAVDRPEGWHSLADVDPATIWKVRRTLRSNLVEQIRRRTAESWLHRGATAAELGWVKDMFDPDVLTLGFARRVPSYKRLTLMLRDQDRLRALLLDPERPMQLVIAGKSHPADGGGKGLVQQMVRFADDAGVRHRIVFLPDYDIGLAKSLVTGCDVWLNNPLRPLEACGTSGMKSALNGGLNLSIRDGWWDELFDGDNGWAIPTADGVTDPDRRDALEATALYELIENQVRTRFYDVDAAGVPTRWVEMVSHTLSSLGPEVLATRMVRDYVQNLYMPAEASARKLCADKFAGARTLASWYDKVRGAWSSVRVLHVESAGAGDTPALGSPLRLRAELNLGALDAGDVEVQAAYGRVDATDALHDVRYVTMSETADGGDGSGSTHFAAEVPLMRPGAFGYTVRVLPRHEMVDDSAQTGLITYA